jgi:hypothetical protein
MWSAYRHRHRPVPDDDGPLLKNPHQVEEAHYGEDYPSYERKRFGVHEHPKFLFRIALKEDSRLRTSR